MTNDHQTGTYKDGYQNIEYCLKCGVEGSQLSEPCEPFKTELLCNDCGRILSFVSCENCENIRLKFLTISRNFPKSKALDHVFKLTKTEVMK